MPETTAKQAISAAFLADRGFQHDDKHGGWDLLLAYNTCPETDWYSELRLTVDEKLTTLNLNLLPISFSPTEDVIDDLIRLLGRPDQMRQVNA